MTNEIDRRPTSLGAVLYAGSVASWFSRTQHYATLSTTESVSTSHLLSEVIWEVIFLRRVLGLVQPGREMRNVTSSVQSSSWKMALFARIARSTTMSGTI